MPEQERRLSYAESVSYTHLDVYKRQVYDYVITSLWHIVFRVEQQQLSHLYFQKHRRFRWFSYQHIVRRTVDICVKSFNINLRIIAFNVLYTIFWKSRRSLMERILAETNRRAKKEDVSSIRNLRARTDRLVKKTNPPSWLCRPGRLPPWPPFSYPSVLSRLWKHGNHTTKNTHTRAVFMVGDERDWTPLPQPRGSKKLNDFVNLLIFRLFYYFFSCVR